MRKFKIYGDIETLTSSEPGTFGYGTLTVGSNLVIKEPTAVNQDSAIFCGLFQNENDAGTGEIIAITPPIETGSFQTNTGLDTDQCKLGTSASADAGHYIDYYIKVTTGPYTNAVRKITAYNGGFSKVAQLQTSWTPIALSGTVTTTAGSPVIEADDSSVDFLTYFTPGSMIHVIDGYYEVLEVTDDFFITLTTNYPSNNNGVVTALQPRTGDLYLLNYERYSVLEFEKSDLSWRFGYTNSDPQDSNLTITRLGNIQVNNIDTVNINENPTDASTNEIVEILDNASTAVDIVGSGTRGSYMVLVQSVDDDGACGIFHVVKARANTEGLVNMTSGDPSITNEMIDISFDADQKMKLFHTVTKTGGSGALIQYRVKVDKITINS